MEIKIYVSAAVISALIALIGGAINSFIAQNTAMKTARETARQEIKKLERTWQREDRVAFNAAFTEMCSAVANFVSHLNGGWQPKALTKISAVRTIAPPSVAPTIDVLYSAVLEQRFYDADQYLSLAIEEKRKYDSLNADTDQ